MRFTKNGCQRLSGDSWEQVELSIERGVNLLKCTCSLRTPYFSRLIDETQRVISVVFSVVLLYYCNVKAETNIIILWSRKQKKKNPDRKRKPADPTTLTKIVMNVNLLSNRKPKQQGETFSLSGWKNTSGCDTTTQMVCCVRFALSLAKQIPSLLAALISELRH